MNRKEIRSGIEAHLRHLSVTLGDRSVYRPQVLKAAEDYILNSFTGMGYPVSRQTIIYQGRERANIIAGTPDPRGYYLLGAHVDTVSGSPGADDNASAVAVMLEVARLARPLTPQRPWVFIGFTLEEPPAYFTPYMGSRVYARQARRNGHQILGMLCLEMVGYYRQEPGSQELPLSLRLLGFSTTGNFIGLVSDRRSRPLMERLEASLRRGCRLPTQSLWVPLGGSLLPETRLSDHANFWDEGYPAVMVTDTAFMRNPHYHTARDTMEKLDLNAMTELTLGLLNFLEHNSR